MKLAALSDRAVQIRNSFWPQLTFTLCICNKKDLMNWRIGIMKVNHDLVAACGLYSAVCVIYIAQIKNSKSGYRLAVPLGE